MLVMAETPLKKLRQEVGYTQQDFAVAASLRITTYQHAERGQNTSFTTAQSILRTLNGLRINRNLENVTLEDLGLKIV